MGEVSWNALKQIVYERANGCCEYCQTCEANSGQTMQVDHIDPMVTTCRTTCVYPAGIAIAANKATHGTLTRRLGSRVPLFNPRRIGTASAFCKHGRHTALLEPNSDSRSPAEAYVQVQP